MYTVYLASCIHRIWRRVPDICTLPTCLRTFQAIVASWLESATAGTAQQECEDLWFGTMAGHFAANFLVYENALSVSWSSYISCSFLDGRYVLSWWWKGWIMDREMGFRKKTSWLHWCQPLDCNTALFCVLKTSSISPPDWNCECHSFHWEPCPQHLQADCCKPWNVSERQPGQVD